MQDETRAYIAGFLDGDGSIIFQIVRRTDYALGFQIRASVCFYQKSTADQILYWLRKQFEGVGYIRQRGPMSDYTIVGRDSVRRVLRLIAPYVVAKRRQVDIGLRILQLLDCALTERTIVKVAKLVDRFAQLNYSKAKKIAASNVSLYLRSRP